MGFRHPNDTKPRSPADPLQLLPRRFTIYAMEEQPIQPIQVLHPRPRPLRQYLYRHALWFRPFVVAEWLCDWAAWGLSRWAFVTVLQHIGTLSILVGVIFYFAEAPNRLKQKHYQAWQVINTAQGKGGAGGRIEALMELNSDGEPLVGVDVSKAFLENIQLPHAGMRRAELDFADMMNANLAHADLNDADLEYTNLRNANLEGINLEGAYLVDADLTGANLQHADLRRARLYKPTGPNEEPHHAELVNADLRFADLDGLKWEGANFKGANIFGVKNAPPGFVDAAMKMGAISKPD